MVVGIAEEDVVALTEVEVVELATTAEVEVVELATTAEVEVVELATSVVIVEEVVMLDVVTLTCAGLCWAAVGIGEDSKLDITRNITTISKGTRKFLLNNGPGYQKY